MKFFEEFYKISDTSDAHERYADSFTRDGTIVMASKRGEGREGEFYFSWLFIFWEWDDWVLLEFLWRFDAWGAGS